MQSSNPSRLFWIVMAFAIPPLAVAQSWSYPFGYPWKRAPLAWLSLDLIAPVNNQVVTGSRNQDLNPVFGWESEVGRRQSLAERYRRPYTNFGLARASPQRQFTLCIFEHTRCDHSGTGVQQESFGSSRFARTWIVGVIPYQQLQGKAFQWAVRECVYDRVHPEIVTARQRCAWSASNNLIWRLPAPDQLHADQDEQTYGGLWHLAFHWSRVTNTDRYVICMSANLSSLDTCMPNTDPQPGAAKESKSGTTYVRLGEPPVNAGSMGASFFWKVAACRQDLSLPEGLRCSDWSATSQSVWPAQ